VATTADSDRRMTLLSRIVSSLEWRFVVPLGVAGLLACGGGGHASPGAAAPGVTPNAPGTTGATPGPTGPGTGAPAQGANPSGPPAAASSSLVATPIAAPSNGAPITLSVTVRDAAGNPVPGVFVSFSAPGVNIASQPGPTDANGVASATVTSFRAGTQTVTVTSGGAPIGAVTVTFTAAPGSGAPAGCSDGMGFPAGGFTVGLPPVTVAANWSPHVFTGTAGSIFVPDLSFYEHNDPNRPLTGGGHNWVFDQGSTLCKVTDDGPAGGTPDAWSIPPVSPTDCITLPIIGTGVVKNIGDIPYQGDVITPTCDPTLLSQPGAPNPANTYFNQLGCSISHGVATTPQSATSFLFVAGIKSGLFSIPLNNVTNPAVGGNAGKMPGAQNYYSAIPGGQLLTNAIVSKDGQFAIATSRHRLTAVYACFNPLGDPGDPSLPINPKFFVPPASTVHCMQVGSNALQVDLTDAFGPDNQPYFGGQRVVNAFDSVPGGPSSAAWPNCIWQNNGSTSLADAFQNGRANGCGGAQPNFAFTSANIIQPQALLTHGQYMYASPIGGTVVQMKVTTDPSSGLSQYQFRTYVTGLSIVTGLGVAEDFASLMIYTDPSAIGSAAQEVVTKLPLCEDM
jgi:Bacterial Ig-like domain (group 1)